MSHERYIKLIDEMIVGDVPTAQWNELHRHLAGCTSCRARYDRVSLAERMLHGGPGALSTPSSSTLKRLEGAVLGATAARDPAWQRALQWFAPTQRWAVGVAADPPQKIVNGPKTLISIAHPECKTALGGSAPNVPCVPKLIHGLRAPQCRFTAIRKSHQMNVVRPGPSDFRRNILRTGRPQPTTMPISKTPLPAPEQ